MAKLQGLSVNDHLSPMYDMSFTAGASALKLYWAGQGFKGQVGFSQNLVPQHDLLPNQFLPHER